MIDKKVDKEGVILHVKSNVIVKLENMLIGLEYLKKDKTLPRNLRIFEDATNSEVAFNKNDIDILIKKMHEVVQEYNTIRHAVLHDSPKGTAFAMLIERNKIDTNYMLKSFSTTNAASVWLNSK